MKKENGGARKSGDFLAGKGFYIVLFVCIAIIGVSAWILVFTNGATTGPAQTALIEQAQPVPPPPTVDETSRPQLPAISEEVFAPRVPEPPPVPMPEPTEPPPPPPPAVQTAAPVPEAPPPPPPQPRERPVEEMTFIWPVMGRIEIPFSIDMPVFNRTLGVWRTHPGIAIAAAIGTRVLATTDGVVVDVFEDDMLGTMVVIDHGSNLKSIYANLARRPAVSPGDNVTAGAVIGAVGDTSLSGIGQVAHLHLEMTINGEPVNPENFLPTR
ncbi:MAG: M23 family metallopeptidase [Oscillospiraceae bacterium]|nr:M23 family metallopeptidase [Oscillospiraceae bacterium]